jgi:inosine-uridine nucleoside N-ribohydrolase
VNTVPMHIEVRQDPPEQGRTVATPGQPNANVAVDADAARFRALFLELFNGTH